MKVVYRDVPPGPKAPVVNLVRDHAGTEGSAVVQLIIDPTSSVPVEQQRLDQMMLTLDAVTSLRNQLMLTTVVQQP